MPWLRMLGHFGIQDVGFGFFAVHEAIRHEVIVFDDALALDVTIHFDNKPAPHTVVSIAAAFIALLGTAFVIDHAPDHVSVSAFTVPETRRTSGSVGVQYARVIVGVVATASWQTTTAFDASGAPLKLEANSIARRANAKLVEDVAKDTKIITIGTMRTLRSNIVRVGDFVQPCATRCKPRFALVSEVFEKPIEPAVICDPAGFHFGPQHMIGKLDPEVRQRPSS